MSLATRKIAICLALAAVTLATYWPVGLNDFLSQYDDQDYVTANSQVLRGLSWEGVFWAFRTGHAANWHPLTWLSHMLDVQLFGLNPAGHRFTNVFFHIANTVLIFLFLGRTTNATWRSALVAALFALHPLHVESVAWVAERKDVLSTFFGLLAIWAYAEYARKSQVQSLESKVQDTKSVVRGPWSVVRGSWSIPHLPSVTLYLLSLALFALSLMSKPMLVTLPFLLLLLDYWPLGRLRLETQGSRLKALLPFLMEKLPFFLLSALSSLVTLSVQQEAMSYARQLSFLTRAANAAISCARYLGKTLWPQDLAVFYPHPAQWPVLAVAGSALLLAVVSSLALWRSRQSPYVLVGWFWFLGLLVPVLGLVQVGAQAMADRYTYLPLVGIFILLVWGGAECLTAWRLPAKAGITAAALALVLCAVLTRVQLRFWRNTETIFTHAIAVTRDNWVAHYNLALLVLHRYQEGLRGSVENQVVNLESTPTGPGQSRPPPRDYLAEVIYHCQEAIRSRPRFPDPRVTLAKALTEKGRLDEARAQLEMAIRLEPKSADARQNLAEILHRQGRAADAITEYKEALKTRPDWEQVLNNLAWLLATHPSPEVRDGPEAVRFAERACALSNHTNLWYLHTLAAAYAESGDFAQAVVAAEEARQVAAASGLSNLLAVASARLESYKTRQPLRAP